MKTRDTPPKRRVKAQGGKVSQKSAKRRSRMFTTVTRRIAERVRDENGPPIGEVGLNTDGSISDITLIGIRYKDLDPMTCDGRLHELEQWAIHHLEKNGYPTNEGPKEFITHSWLKGFRGRTRRKEHRVLRRGFKRPKNVTWEDIPIHHFWDDGPEILREIAECHFDIRELRKEVEAGRTEAAVWRSINLGMRVQKAEIQLADWDLLAEKGLKSTEGQQKGNETKTNDANERIRLLRNEAASYARLFEKDRGRKPSKEEVAKHLSKHSEVYIHNKDGTARRYAYDYIMKKI